MNMSVRGRGDIIIIVRSCDLIEDNWVTPPRDQWCQIIATIIN